MELPIFLNIRMYDIIAIKALHIYASHENVGEKRKKKKFLLVLLLFYILELRFIWMCIYGNMFYCVSQDIVEAQGFLKQRGVDVDGCDWRFEQAVTRVLSHTRTIHVSRLFLKKKKKKEGNLFVSQQIYYLPINIWVLGRIPSLGAEGSNFTTETLDDTRKFKEFFWNCMLILT